MSRFVVGVCVALAGASLVGCGKAPPIPIGGEDSPEHVAFPPAEPAWQERVPFGGLAGGVFASTPGLHVVMPTVDAKRHFTFDGEVLRIGFDDFAGPDVGDAGVPDELARPTITPTVAATSRWVDPQTIEFRADRAFDPDTEYTLTIPEFTSAQGKKLEGGFTATFRARPSREIAGKTIHYTPKIGVPRVVNVRGSYDALVAPTREFLIIFDQAVDLADAKTMVSAKLVEGGRNVPLSLRHPAEKVYEGIPVDPRVLVLAKMVTPTAPGTKVVLSAKGKREADEPTTTEFEVAQPPTFQGLECNECKVTGTDAVGPVYNWGLQFTFSNSLGFHDDMSKFVQITPKPRNFRAEASQQTLGVHGEWIANTTYTVGLTGLVDRFGYAAPDVHATFRALPRSASTVLRDGVVVLDVAHARDFFVTTRNVARGELRLWPVEPTAAAQSAALKASESGKAPTDKPIVIPFEGNPTPNDYVETKIDLAPLGVGKTFLASAVTTAAAGGAPMPAADGYTSPSLPLLMLVDDQAVGAHLHRVGTRTIAQIYRLGSGEPAAGFGLDLGGAKATTDASGTALLEVGTAQGSELGPLLLEHDGTSTWVPFPTKTQASAGELYPELATATQRYEDSYDDTASGAVVDPERVGFVLTDKGIYRPGALVHVKAFLRRSDGAGVVAVKDHPVRLRVVGPNGDDLSDQIAATGPMGTVARDFEVPAGTQTGRYHVRLEAAPGADAGPSGALYYDQIIRIAEFETPRFKVDVKALESPQDHLKAKVVGAYFFGAPMGGSSVSWSVRKKVAPLPTGTLANAGLTFGANEGEFESYGDTPAVTEQRPVTGEGKLAADGSLVVDAALGALERGPTLVSLEAQVFDASYRMIAGHLETLKHPYPRYAGLKLGSQWGGIGPNKVELGVADHAGNALPGVPVEARLDKMVWKRVAEKAESGAVLESWKAVPTPVATCQAQSAATPQACELDVKEEGSYRITARVDGHDDGSFPFYAWGSSGSAADVPSAGKKIPVVTDKKKYAAGDVAKILARSPFAETIALLAVQQGALIHHETRRVKGSSISFDLPVTAANVPYVHAAITLLPVGPASLGYRVGAVRVPVAAKGGGPVVTVTSSKKSYDVGQDVEVTVEVKRGGLPLAGADVTLAVVDEAILRMTAFHTVDPTAALHPARPLDFLSADSRELLMRRRQKAHVAGDGEGGDEAALETRKDFVETLAWEPNLLTDAQGRATLRVKLKDNLSEFRMMATVLDDQGSGGIAENGFVVVRPFVIDPIVPQFALRGDRLEVAAMAHNNTDAEVKAQVRILREARDVVIPPHGRVRVAVPFTAERTQRLEFELFVGDQAKDRVERQLDVYGAGSEEHPRISGTFHDHQLVDLGIPEDATFPEGAELVVRTGSALYPELGQRLSFLLDYPHGCVEQTTSGLLPLLAAKTLLPWTGLEPIEAPELRARIAAGVKRLASMRTEEGGLAYWPGGTQTHRYGTVYAARALIRASALGIEEGDLLPSVLDYLRTSYAVEGDGVVRASIAEVLTQANALAPAMADSLFDSREALDAYGQASVALALAALPDQKDRVRTVLDLLEARFDDQGKPNSPHGEHDYVHWGSADRDRAQALIALSKLRKTSRLVPVLARWASARVDTYATQSVAWSLMAFAEHVGKDAPSGKVHVSLSLPGVMLGDSRSLGGNNVEVRVPLARLRGQKLTLRLDGDAEQPSAFTVEARYKRPFAASPREARREENGASLYRVYTDTRGRPVNLGQLKAGQVVRVALRAELPQRDAWRRQYFAVTDFFPAGFEPIQPDLATVGQSEDMTSVHPFYAGFRDRPDANASHVDLRADRVYLYFDNVYSDGVVYATYLLRATTPGDFALPSARCELMYEPDSVGFSESGHVVIAP